MAPDRLTEVRSWQGHIPFAFCLMDMLRPRVVVELGVHRGDSFCAFSQAADRLSLACRLHGVDTWEGDSQAGHYGPEVYEELSAYVKEIYGDRIVLHKCRFDEALDCFDDGTVDLLHIDGLHTYDAVRRDFELWRPKLSEQGVVLFHDTQVYRENFGVGRFWEEIRDEFPHFEFLHSHGLGVLGAGSDPPAPAAGFFAAGPEDVIRIRRWFAALGEAVSAAVPDEDPDENAASPQLDNQIPDITPDFEIPVWYPEHPAVSVVIPLYNHERYIREALHSVLAQSETDFEIVVIDDGSPDASLAAARRVRDPRIRIFGQENQGAHAALNRGVALAKGEFIAILNSDDVFHPHRLRECLRVCRENPDLAAVFSAVDCVDENGQHLQTISGPTDFHLCPSVPPPSAEERKTDAAPATAGREDSLLLPLLSGNFLMTTSNLFCRRQVMAQIEGFTACRYAHDYDFFLRLAAEYPARHLSEPLLSYRIHGQNTLKEGEARVLVDVGRVLSRFLCGAAMENFCREHNLSAADLMPFLSQPQVERMLVLAFRDRIQRAAAPEAASEEVPAEDDPAFLAACQRYFEDFSENWQSNQKCWAENRELRQWLEKREADLTAELELHRAAAEKARRDWEAAVQEARESWRESRTAWREVEELNLKLTASDRSLGEALEKRDEFWRDGQTAWKKVEEMNRHATALAQERNDLQVRLNELEASVFFRFREKYLHLLRRCRFFSS